MRTPRISRLAVALALLVSGAACGGSTPARPDPPPTPPAPKVAAPTPERLGCGLPPGGGDGVDCPYASATFVDPVNHAIERAQREHPELFDLGNCDALACPVLDGPRYIEEVMLNLRRAELCVVFDGEEIAIKNTNEFNDQYHILTSSGLSRWGIGSYRATCRPAWF